MPMSDIYIENIVMASSPACATLFSGNNKSDNNSKYIDSSKLPLHVPSEHIIPADSIVINKELGVGEFGVVQQGVWTNETGERVQVAIKCLNEQRMQNNPMEFLKEAAIMHSIDHEHIVRLYGVVLDSSALMLVTELAPLRSLLECLKEPTLRSTFTILSLCDFAVQICDGMAYLESKRLIHRDLAARNILVFAKNRVKISDFGLSRALGVGKDYYQTNFNVNLKLPIAWCAPECINYLKFTSASDCWAYGVTLYEMFSYGFQPWAALTGQQILEAIDEPCFQRLEQPECCPKDYYSIMLRCWEHDPNKRPKFCEISKMLPDCRPELVRIVKEMPDIPSLQSGSSTSSSSSSSSSTTITASDTNNSSKQCKSLYLPCKVGDIVTVLDKDPRLPPNFSLSSVNKSSSDMAPVSLWKGALNNGKSGLFYPSASVAYLGQNLPTSTHSNTTTSNSSSYSTAFKGFIRSFLDVRGNASNNSNNSVNSSKRRLRPEMISSPQGDFKHTGHIGVDGAFFGDIPNNFFSLTQNARHTLKRSFNEKTDQTFLGHHSSDLSDRIPLISTSNDPSSFLFDEKNSNSRNDKANTKSRSSFNDVQKNGANNNAPEHEYHEISNEEDLGSLESPHFETLDFGPSLMDEVFKELGLIKPEFTDELTEHQKAINDCNSNVKNEIKEIANKLALNKESKKKYSTVKSISHAEEQNLDSAIAMAKELATQSMMDLEFKPVNELKTCSDNGSSDSPKTPNSPNKKKFSFKFKSSPKIERRTFSEETENISDIQSILTEEAKKAYSTLVEKGQGLDKCRSSFLDKSGISESCDMRRLTNNTDPISSQTSISSSHIISAPIDCDSVTEESNPLRLLRNGGIMPKVKGNKQRIAATPQTALLARLTANVNRSSLGSPPPVPFSGTSMLITGNDEASALNALPLPPRDRSKQHSMALKQHQRKHPLLIPVKDLPEGSESNGSNESGHISQPVLSTFRHVFHVGHPISGRQVPCPEPPSSYMKNMTRIGAAPNIESSHPSSKSEAISEENVPVPPPKPNRTLLGEDQVDSVPKTFVDLDATPEPDCQSTKNNDSLAQEPATRITNHHVSCEDLLDFAADKPKPKPKPLENVKGIDSDEVRVMLKILGKEVTDLDCLNMLNETDWDALQAIKCIKLGRQLKNHSIKVSSRALVEALAKYNGNRHQAFNYLIATHGLPEDTTEV